MFRFLSVLWKSMLDGQSDDMMLDHVPISGHYNFKKKLAKTRERHGKPFTAQSKIERKLPLSRDLIELNEKSKPVSLIETVYQIKKATK